MTALQLVLCEDPDRAEELAHKLNEINAKRQETERRSSRPPRNCWSSSRSGWRIV